MYTSKHDGTTKEELWCASSCQLRTSGRARLGAWGEKLTIYHTVLVLWLSFTLQVKWQTISAVCSRAAGPCLEAQPAMLHCSHTWWTQPESPLQKHVGSCETPSLFAERDRRWFGLKKNSLIFESVLVRTVPKAIYTDCSRAAGFLRSATNCVALQTYMMDAFTLQAPWLGNKLSAVRQKARVGPVREPTLA